MQRRRRQRAIAQLGAVGLVTAMLAIGGVVAARRPADATALAAEVAIVRSQAAETVLLHDLRPMLPVRFVRAHADQLATVSQKEAEQLRSMDVQPTLDPAAATARTLATRVAARANELAGSAERFDRSGARSTVDALAALERELRQ